MANREPFALEEWYHCYSRSIDKRSAFNARNDYERFIQLLYLANSSKSLHRSDLRSPSTEEVLVMRREAALVSVGAFCLMPNHFHLLLRETTEGGISAYMRKLGTAYTMYFNIKNKRIGNLFLKPFRSRHVETDEYLQYVVQYIHCNPAELFERGWKKAKVRNLSTLQSRLVSYPYSTLGAFQDAAHPFRAIVGDDVFNVVRSVPAAKMVKEAAAYYQELSMSR